MHDDSNVDLDTSDVEWIVPSSEEWADSIEALDAYAESQSRVNVSLDDFGAAWGEGDDSWTPEDREWT